MEFNSMRAKLVDEWVLINFSLVKQKTTTNDRCKGKLSG